MGGIAIAPDGTVYLNSSGAIMRYNGEFTSFPYPLSFTSASGTIEFSALGDIQSLAAESDGTIVTFANALFSVSNSAQTATERVTLSPQGHLDETVTVFPPLDLINYDAVVPGPFGSVVAISPSACEGCNGPQLLVIEPPGAPAIQMPSFPAFNSIQTLTQGTDGMAYIAASSAAGVEEILKVNPSTGQILNTTRLPSGSLVRAMTAGPDGAVWFTDTGLGKIGRVTPHGEVTYFAVTPGGVLSGILGAITAASDNALWFVDGPFTIGRISTTGQVNLYQVPEPEGSIDDITSGTAGSCVPDKIFFANNSGLGILTFSS